MLIQFGYVTLFSSAFPMAAVCALLNNVIEIRSDAFKLCMSFQRPFGELVENIGIWQVGQQLIKHTYVTIASFVLWFITLSSAYFYSCIGDG